MDTHWAAENLQVIRTLMERSTLYRRALAPVMLVSGGVGVGASVLPRWVPVETNRGFALYWMVVSVAALTASLLLVRRQALQAAEPFWSPPTRRVSQAVLPAFLVALLAGVFNVVNANPWGAAHLAQLWIIVYGCALHAAGFFTPRGIRVFGWLLVLGGCALVFLTQSRPELRSTAAAHAIMGVFFGGCHLAYGLYLSVTEPRSPAA
ncbi:MAG: hypothetical protein RJA22_1788 [Verrucomicrobiota bacterium]|jgi:hypothetical protein